MIRKFYIENSLGNRYSLQDTNVLGRNPSGLGAEVTFESVILGESKKVTETHYELIDKHLSIVFRGTIPEVYQAYQDFVRFLSRKPLRLIYVTPNTFEEYWCDVILTRLDKTEVNEANVLECDLELSPVDFWRNSRTNILDVGDDDEGSGKKYPLKRPYSYGSKSLSEVSISNNGFYDAPFTIEIDGTTTNPIITLYDANDVRYGQARLIGTFDKIVINSDELNESIQLVQNGVELTDPYNYQDLTYLDDETALTFMKLKVGQSKMAFTLGLNFSGTIRITWNERYITI